jgi:hypothetical protein
MATGNYGIVRPADVSVEDMQVFYTFASDRSTTPTGINELGSENLITTFTSPGLINSQTTTFGGLYNMTLPEDIFNQVGFYNIIIKPREFTLDIIDCGVLDSSPDIKGIVLDANTLPPNLVSENGLIGYRVEYFSSVTGLKIPNLFRIITSSGRVEPVNQTSLNNSSQKSIRYRYNDNGSLIFCTLTPTSTTVTLPNRLPFIGEPDQTITLTNTYFNPVFIELEITEYDLKTLSYGIYGNQIKSINDGIYTIYDDNNQIYKQYNLYEIQDETGNPLYEVREDRGDNINLTKNFNRLTSI